MTDTDAVDDRGRSALIGVDALAKFPDVTVIIVDGDEEYQRARLLFPKNAVLSWDADGNPYLNHLKGRRVILWPRYDVNGSILGILRAKAMRDAIAPIADELRLVVQGAPPIGLLNAKEAHALLLDDKALHLCAKPPREPEPEPEPEPPEPERYLPDNVVPINEAAAARMEYTRADMEATGTHAELKSYRHRFVLGGKNGDVIIKCMANCILPFREDPAWQGVLRFDEMRQVIRCVKPTPWGEEPEQWTGSHDVRATEWLDRIGLHYGPAQVAEAILRVAQENGYHPVREYLDTVQPTWDNAPRADSWLIDYCGAPDTPFVRFVAAKFLIAAVARARQPGCFVKNVLLLHGPQDAGKSWVPEILGGAWYGELLSLSDNMKATEQCSKLWVIENSDMAGTHKAGDELVKKFIATRADTYRPAYARHVVDMKRCCVFIFTANPDEMLTDSTGNVRYWPIEVSKVNKEGLRAVRDQLWAEAAHRQAQGELWWIEDNADDIRAQAHAEQEKRLVRDEWTTAIRDWLEQPEQRALEFFRLRDVLDKALGMGTDRQTLAEQRRAGAVMKLLGFLKRNRDNVRVWVRPVVLAEWEPGDAPEGMFEE